jgi:Fe2+ or Zn2+ uptake regulation protein
VRSIDAEQGFSVDVGHLAIFGLCRDCRAALDHQE